MKRRTLIVCALLLAFGLLLAGCKMNQPKNNTTTPGAATTVPATTERNTNGAVGEGITDVSKGAGELGSDIREGITDLSQGAAHGATNISEALTR